MITFPKFKTASFAINKRLQGYHLLKNPAGTPNTEVNMVKTMHDKVNRAGVRITITDRIIRKTDKSGSKNIEKRNVISYRIYDYENKKFSKARKIDLWVRNKYKSRIFKQSDCTYSYIEDLLDHSMQEMNDIQKQMQEFNKKIKFKKPNFFKVLYQNLRGKGVNNYASASDSK